MGQSSGLDVTVPDDLPGTSGPLIVKASSFERLHSLGHRWSASMYRFDESQSLFEVSTQVSFRVSSGPSP